MVGTQRVRVLHIVDKFGVDDSVICGVTRLFTSWAPELTRANFETHVVCLKARGRIDAELARHGVNVTYLDKRKAAPSTLPALARVIDQVKPHILHLHGFGAGIFGRILGRLRGIPVVIHEHVAPPKLPPFQGPIERLLAPLAAWTIGVSNSAAQFCVEKRHLPQNKVSVVYNGAPLGKLRKTSPRHVERLRQALNIPQDAHVIGAVGRLHEQKGLRHLLDAMPAILAEEPSTRLLIVGEGTQRDLLEEQAKVLGLTESVIFTGYRRNVPAYLSLIDVLAIPSLFEGLPLTAIEAMALGTPILCSPVDGLGEVLTDYETALFSEPGNVAALSTNLVALLRDPALRTELAENAKVLANDFHIRNSVLRMQEIYRAILPQPAKVAGRAPESMPSGAYAVR